MHRTLFAAVSAISLVATGALAQQPVAPTLPLDPNNTAKVLQPGAGVGGGKYVDAPVSSLGITAGIDIRSYGMVPGGGSSAANGTALTKIFASTGSQKFVVPVGTFEIPCGVTYAAASGISFWGQDKESSILQYPAGCSWSGVPLMLWNGVSGGGVHNLTIDLNTPATPSAVTAVVSAEAYNAPINGFQVINSKVINGTSPMFLVSAAAVGGNNFYGLKFNENYLSLSVPDVNQNQCIVLSTNNGSGFIPSAQVNNNVCVNSAIQIDGAAPQVIANDVSGYKFGNGIFLAYVPGAGTTPSATDCLVANNIIHDTVAGEDVNNVPHDGIENNCLNSIVIGNKAYNLGGAGFFNFANNATYIGNTAYNIGINGSGGSGGFLDVSGFSLEQSTSTIYYSQNVTMIGNTTYDTGGGTTKYGYAEEPYHTFSSTLRANKFSGVTQNEIIQPGGTTNSDVGYVSTVSQLISAVSSIQFTNLDAASYATWSLACTRMTPTTASAMLIQVGEGTGPTWETAGSYGNVGVDSQGGTVTAVNSGTSTGIALGVNNYDNTQVAPATFTADFGALSWTNGTKLFSVRGAYFKSASGYDQFSMAGAWNGDNNPVTAIRVVSAGGYTFNGQCTLTGRP